MKKILLSLILVGVLAVAGLGCTKNRATVVKTHPPQGGGAEKALETTLEVGQKITEAALVVELARVSPWVAGTLVGVDGLTSLGKLVTIGATTTGATVATVKGSEDLEMTVDKDKVEIKTGSKSSN